MAKDYHRLGRRISAERASRGYTQESFASAAGLGLRTVSHLEAGTKTNYLDSTLSKVEHALGWPVGACKRVLEGQSPYVDDPNLTRLRSVWFQLSDDVQYVLATVAELSAGRGRSR